MHFRPLVRGMLRSGGAGVVWVWWEGVETAARVVRGT